MANRLSLLLSAALCMLGSGYLRADDARIDFVKQVKPILGSRCINCHQSEALFGNLNLENRLQAFKKRLGGPVILPGKPDSSPLYIVLRLPAKDPKSMPPDGGHRISEGETRTIYTWIKQGAEWPKGADGTIPPVKVQKARQ